MLKNIKPALLIAAGVALWAASPAAAENAMQVCGAKYQAAKAAKTLPAGQTWNQFLAQCRASMPKTAAAPASPAKAMAAAPAAPMMHAAVAPAPKRAPGVQTPGELAAHARQKDCGRQWTAAKTAGKIPQGQTWPQYWSLCNKRMKG